MKSVSTSFIRTIVRSIVGSTGVDWFNRFSILLDDTPPSVVAQYSKSRYAVNGKPKTFDELHTFTRSTTATYEDSSGILQTAAINAPRFNYSGGVAQGLLIEDAATNLEPNSSNGLNSTITVSTGDNTISMTGTGSLAVVVNTAIGTGFGTATEGSPVTFNISTGGTVDLTVTGTVDTKQLEAGANATSYIPTSGSTVSRDRDVCTIDGTRFTDFWNATQGTMYIDQNIDFQADWVGVISANDGTSANLIELQQSNTGNAWQFISDTSVTQVNAGVGASMIGVSSKEAFAYELNNSVGANGGTVGTTDTTCTIPTVTQLDIFNKFGFSHTNGHVKEVRYYPVRGLNTSLEDLTTPSVYSHEYSSQYS